MTAVPGSHAAVPAVGDTLRRIVAGYRILSWVWMAILLVVALVLDQRGNRAILLGAFSLATVWTVLTLWLARDDRRLGSIVFVIVDGVIALGLSAAGLLAGTQDFISGGWPGSWLFVVAFAANLRWTMLASSLLVFEHVLLHFGHGFGLERTAGTFLFIAVGVIVGWAFDNLRLRERLRLAAEAELAEEREATARYEERAELARQLHDSVLQTLHAIRVDADHPDEVRYLTRRQERELRRTIEEFSSPHRQSFRAQLLRYRDEVEDLCQWVKIVDVIRDDADVTPQLESALGAAREAMMNAAKHSGADQVDLYSEIADGEVVIHVRDRGKGYDPDGKGDRNPEKAIMARLESVGGKVQIDSAPGEGTEVTIKVLQR